MGVIEDLRSDRLLFSPGVYVHTPFCERVCTYCAFSVQVARLDQVAYYLDAMTSEYQIKKSLLSRPPRTLYIGGGTPSLLDGDLLRRFVLSMKLKDLDEFTIEVNPESITKEKLDLYRRVGVTRVSLGVQSFDDEILRFFGRSHDVRTATKAIEMISRAGGIALSIDLIYGAGPESDSSWEKTLSTLTTVVDRVDHVSGYALTLERKTKLSVLSKRSQGASSSVVQSDDTLAQRYFRLSEVLEGSGFYNYETSNWSKVNAESRHNLNYWVRGEYLGVGCSAHSFISGERSANAFSMARYLAKIARHEDPTEFRETLSSEQELLEGILLGLRCAVGVPTASLRHVPAVVEDLVCIEGEYLTLTKRGRMLADRVALELLTS